MRHANSAAAANRRTANATNATNATNGDRPTTDSQLRAIRAICCRSGGESPFWLDAVAARESLRMRMRRWTEGKHVGAAISFSPAHSLPPA